ncbi:hypothetical protein C8J55DRAFT_488990 [Lentinula edodes]|uniref:Uncharacterized protein n=1 Tax=Lentinula lateritia TaxID=40482 RepID=A0A9W9ADP8_9AGAR|nr:hypothetical protein C8J55DRAFT_488990 [Lentinula edodes]
MPRRPAHKLCALYAFQKVRPKSAADGWAFFTRLWTTAECSGKLATPTTSLEGEASGTNSVRVLTVCGYLLFWSREGGGQNHWCISYWRSCAAIDHGLFVLNAQKSIRRNLFLLGVDSLFGTRSFNLF